MRRVIYMLEIKDVHLNKRRHTKRGVLVWYNERPNGYRHLCLSFTDFMVISPKLKCDKEIERLLPSRKDRFGKHIAASDSWLQPLVRKVYQLPVINPLLELRPSSMKKVQPEFSETVNRYELVVWSDGSLTMSFNLDTIVEAFPYKLHFRVNEDHDPKMIMVYSGSTLRGLIATVTREELR